MNPITETDNVREQLLADLRQEQATQDQRLHEIAEALQEHHRQMQLLNEEQATQQRRLLFIRRQIQQAEHEIQHPPVAGPSTFHQHIPWPTRAKSLATIRKPKFVDVLRQMTGKTNVTFEFEALQANASIIMKKLIASHQAVHFLPTSSMSWNRLPNSIKALAIAQLENMADLGIRNADDHWMAAYLLSEQCTEVRWHQPASPSVFPEASFITAFQATKRNLEVSTPSTECSHGPGSSYFETATEASANSPTTLITTTHPASPDEPSFIPPSPEIPTHLPSPAAQASPYAIEDVPATPENPLPEPHSVPQPFECRPLQRTLSRRSDDDDDNHVSSGSPRPSVSEEPASSPIAQVTTQEVHPAAATQEEEHASSPITQVTAQENHPEVVTQEEEHAPSPIVQVTIQEEQQATSSIATTMPTQDIKRKMEDNEDKENLAGPIEKRQRQ